MIGGNYEALLHLSVQYRNSLDIVYTDPSYGKDCMGQFADTKYGICLCHMKNFREYWNKDKLEFTEGKKKLEPQDLMKQTNLQKENQKIRGDNT